MKIRRKRTVQETVQPKTQLPKSRPWVKTTPESTGSDEKSFVPTVQCIPVNTRELLGRVSTLAPQENVYRSPAPPKNRTDRLYPQRVPRQDRSISPPRQSPLFSKIQRSPEPQPTAPPKNNLNWGNLSSPLQRQRDNSPLPTPWKPAHLLQRQSLIQRKDDPPGATTTRTPTPHLEEAQELRVQDLASQNQNSRDRSNGTQTSAPTDSSSPGSPDIQELQSQLQQSLDELATAQNQFNSTFSDNTENADAQLEAIDQWIERKAGQSGYLDIFYIYKNQPPLQRQMILAQLGVNNLSLKEAKSKLKSRQLSKLGRKGFAWKQFADALQTVRAVNPWDETLVQDMSEIGGIITSVGAASISQIADWTGGQAVADWSGEIASLLGVIGLMITAYREYTELLGNHDLGLYRTRMGKLGATLADIGRYSSTGLVTLSQASDSSGLLHTLGSGLSTAAATSAAGAFAIVGGAINVGVGISQYRQAAENKKNLDEISNRDDLNSDLTKGAKLGAKNQGWEKISGGAKVLKGTAMILGGALLLAGLGPAGWIALAVGGLIAGTVAIAKYIAWSKRKKDFVAQELAEKEELQYRYHRYGATTEKERAAINEDYLKQQGYVNADHYYYSRLNEIAGTVLAKAETEMKVLQQREDVQAYKGKNEKRGKLGKFFRMGQKKLINYMKENNLDPSHYPGLAILAGLGLYITVNGIADGQLPQQHNVVKQLDYSS